MLWTTKRTTNSKPIFIGDAKTLGPPSYRFHFGGLRAISSDCTASKQRRDNWGCHLVKKRCGAKMAYALLEGP